MHENSCRRIHFKPRLFVHPSRAVCGSLNEPEKAKAEKVGACKAS